MNTTTQVGGAIGLAVLATLATERTASLVADGESRAEALNGGYHLAYLVGALLLVVAVAVAVFVIRAEPAAAQEQAPKERERQGARQPAFAKAD